MSRRPRAGGLAGSPVLVGAATVLVAVVAVFLSYNAVTGLPFVPAYELKANVPNAAQLVEGFEVRIGGARVGTISKMQPKQRADGSTYAQLTLKLDTEVKPLPSDSTLVIRPRSSMGLKYVQITPGRGEDGFDEGATIPIRQARPRPVEFDEALSMFDAEARVGWRRTLEGYGDGLAGRGGYLNTAIEQFRPLLDNLTPVARDLASREARLPRLLKESGDLTAELAPVAGQQASMFVNLDRTFGALASVARPFLQDTLTEGARAEQVAIEDFPGMRTFLAKSGALVRELAPGVATLPATAPVLADAFEAGTEALPKTPPVSRAAADTFDALADFSEDPLVEGGLTQLTRLSASLRPTLHFLTPAQTVCNYATLALSQSASVLSDGYENGTWASVVGVVPPIGPDSEFGPSAQPAHGPDEANYLHYNPYPNTAAPGQIHECEAGNEYYFDTRQQVVIGNAPGDQGTTTKGQPAGDTR